LSFWMQLLKQKVARRANSEVQRDGVCKGAFWKGRFEMTIINTREHLLTCSVYIDLNPFRAKMTDSLEGYAYTSIYMQMMGVFREMLDRGDLAPTEDNPLGEFPESAMLAPIEFVEEKVGALTKSEEVKTRGSKSKFRCSDTGFLEITGEQYCELVRWSMGQLGADREGAISGLEHAVVASHGMSMDTWRERLMSFRRMYRHEAGISRRKLYERFCGKLTPATFLSLRDIEMVEDVGEV